MAYSLNLQTGVIVPDTSELRNEVVQEWQQALGADIVTSPDTPQGVMITAETLAREAVANNNAQLANQINPNLSGGVFLDAVCALMGLERRAAVPSVITNVRLAGQPGTLIPAGSQAKSEDGNIWTLRTNTQLGPDGAAVGVFVCTLAGPVGCLPGQLSTVVDTVLGWETVVNITAAITGTLEESDAELRQRRRLTLARQGISTREAQISGLMDTDGVTSVAYRENVSNAAQTIDGVPMVPHSVWACVDGGTDEAVAAVLLQNKTDGAAWNGDIEIQVTDPASGQLYNVKFDRPRYIEPSISVTLRRNGYVQDPNSEIPQAIVNWANGRMPGDSGLAIGVDVSPFEIAGAINYYNPSFSVSRVDLYVGNTPYPNGIPVSLRERAVVTTFSVSVVVI